MFHQVGPLVILLHWIVCFCVDIFPADSELSFWCLLWNYFYFQFLWEAELSENYCFCVFLHLYLNIFILLLSRTVPIIHALFWPGFLPCCCRWWLLLCVIFCAYHFCRFHLCLIVLKNTHVYNSSPLCHRYVFLPSIFLWFGE